MNGNEENRQSDDVSCGRAGKKKGKGCFFWGCATLLVVSLLAGGALFLVYKKVANTVEEFTSSTPGHIESVQYTEDERERADSKISAFVDKVKKGDSVVSGEFTDRELNIYLDSHAKFRNKVRLDFTGGEIKSALNVPLSGVPMMNGRYLVGDAVLKVTCENGDLNIKIVSLNVNGKKMSGEFAKAVKEMNFAKNVYDNPNTRAIAKRIKTVEMRGEKLFVEINPKR
jgi:hypothetical protein